MVGDDNTNYDRVNTQLEDVEATAEKARKIVSPSTNNEPTKKIVSRRGVARFNTSRQHGPRSRSSTSPTPPPHVPTLTHRQSCIL